MSAGLPPEAWAAHLAGLPGVTPARLRQLLAVGPPEEVAARLTRGDRGLAPSRTAAGTDPLAVLASWQAVAGADAAARTWERCVHLGVRVVVQGWPGYPDVLSADHAAPAVLFARGDPGVLAGRRCAVVGTRNPTQSGREMAALLGAGLARHGVRVVSGLARGVDGVAHRAALADGGAPPVGVVASGLDVVYPREHAALWEEVAGRGLLLSEVPPGTPPEAHRFPLRNRVLAALSEAVVVVESRATGGSLLTAREALDRGIDVLAVPGSPRNPAAAGTNELVRDGARVVLGPDDVLVALGFTRPADPPARGERRPRPAPADAAVLALFEGEVLDVDTVARCTGRPLGDVLSSLGRLVHQGWLRRSGGWFEAVGAP
jgi:DNA processing protein